ncbi:platelet-derived growth factor receptor alpha-like isoform X2 [Neodiprion lecontei]|uniref:receptor protein-tyrosine kinase n=1 Tax=Neodiprion lecontei TaxID=441921 RepID=A0ABM3GGJ4_NEOLC|nr:platelet-derived growth factor receptor alpha-like isoform X2 [Neodiprion lecontei]
MKPPFIDEDKLRHLVRGRNQTLRCYITDETHDPFKDKYYLTWKAPGAIPAERLRRENTIGKEAVLTIVDVRETDSGEYTCTVTGTFRDIALKSVRIQFYDPNEEYINVTDISPLTQTINATETAVWEVDIDTYPEGNITWLDTEKTEISNSTRYSHDVSGTKHTFQIRNVGIADFGSYTIRINYGNESNEHELELKVRAPPTAKIESAPNRSYKRNETQEFRCRISGYPLPNVTWRYSESAGPRSDNKSVETIFPPTGKGSLENPPTGFLSFLKTSINATGGLTCRSCNEIDCAESTMTILVAGGQPPAEPSAHKDVIWISSICGLIIIIIVVVICMGAKVNRERRLKKILFDSVLTHFEDGALECLNHDLTVDEQAELLPYDKKWEFPREDLKLGKQLGSGAFGVVMKAEARGIRVAGETTIVAVKMVRRSTDPSYLKALSGELKIMIHLGRHLNVVNLLGACTKTIRTKRELYVIVEYCRFGNLHQYLQRHRATFIDQIDPSTKKINPNIGMELLARSLSITSQDRVNYASLSFSCSNSTRTSYCNGDFELTIRRHSHEGDSSEVNMSPDGADSGYNSSSVQPGWRSNYRGDYTDHNLNPVCTRDLLCWAWQVSRGMEYLSSRNVLHGDLAARNILLADDNVVKICDFGLARNMYNDKNYTKKGDCPLPVKWMAIESIRDRIFSTQSDVWSFGIVLWEFFTLAYTPYPGLEFKDQYDKLIEGYRMEKPEYATEEIYDIMLKCWNEKPTLRPTFSDLVEKFGSLLNEEVKTHYFRLNTVDADFNIETFRDGRIDYLTMMSAPNGIDHIPHVSTSDGSSATEYLSMSPGKKIGDTFIVSPCPELDSSHFEYPPPNTNAPDNPDLQIRIEPTPSLALDVPLKHSIAKDDQGAEKSQLEEDHRYCDATNVSQNRSVLLNNSSDKLANKANCQMNIMKNLSPLLIGKGDDDYVNMPQSKVDPAKDTSDSRDNSNYVIIRKNRQNSIPV